jgi:recombination protein RecT
MSDQKSIVKRPTDRLKQVIQSPTVQEQFRNALGENSGMFVASLIDLYASDSYLQQCEPGKVVMEALKAATLKLPINKSLGFAYVIPYKTKSSKQEPQFQMGYKGLIQLAMRTGQYRYINADKVLEGELKRHDKMTGEIELGEPTGSKVIGYFAMIETVNGFRKVIFWTRDQVEAHAKRFSKAYNSTHSPWKTDFDAMALKTLLKSLLGKYGIMSIEMANAFSKDSDADEDPQAEIDANANQEPLDIEPEKDEGDTPNAEFTEDPPPITPEEAAEIEAQEQAEAQATGADGPGF